MENYFKNQYSEPATDRTWSQNQWPTLRHLSVLESMCWELAWQYAKSQQTSVKIQGVNFVHIIGSVATAQLCHCSTKAARWNTHVKRYVCIPIKLYLHKQKHKNEPNSLIWLSGIRMPTLVRCTQGGTKCKKFGILANY